MSDPIESPVETALRKAIDEQEKINRALERIVEVLCYRTADGQSIKHARQILEQWKTERFE